MSESLSPESSTAALTASSACAASGLSAVRVACEKPTPLTAILHLFSHIRFLSPPRSLRYLPPLPNRGEGFVVARGPLRLQNFRALGGLELCRIRRHREQ